MNPPYRVKEQKINKCCLVTFIDEAIPYERSVKNTALKRCPLDRSQRDSAEALCGSNRSFWHLLTYCKAYETLCKDIIIVY